MRAYTKAEVNSSTPLSLSVGEWLLVVLLEVPLPVRNLTRFNTALLNLVKLGVIVEFCWT